MDFYWSMNRQKAKHSPSLSRNADITKKVKVCLLQFIVWDKRIYWGLLAHNLCCTFELEQMPLCRLVQETQKHCLKVTPKMELNSIKLHNHINF